MIITLCVLLVLAFGIACLLSPAYDWREFAGIIATTLGSICLLLILITVPISRMNAYAYIGKVEAARLTRAVDSSDPLEGAAWRIYAAQTNAELAEMRYYNASLFDIWWPEEIDKVRPLK